MREKRPAPRHPKIWTPPPTLRGGLPFARRRPGRQTSPKQPRHSPVERSVGSGWWGRTLLLSLPARPDGRLQPPPRREGNTERLLGELRHIGKTQTKPDAGDSTAGERRHRASWQRSTAQPSAFYPSPSTRQLCTFHRDPSPSPRSGPAARRAPTTRRRPPPRSAFPTVGAKGWPPACRYATIFANVKPISFFLT